MRGAGLAAVLLGLITASAMAWDVDCRIDGVKCPDPFARVQTEWEALPHNEHRLLLERSLTLAGIPPSVQLPFELAVYTNGGKAAPSVSYTSVRPVRVRANAARVRRVAVPMFASLPDFSYALWDWASGNETCPPDPSNADALDCHNYETHIGWLNSNHMLPQARRFYEHLHRIAVARARECKQIFQQLPATPADRFRDYVLACEKGALVVEAVAEHYLQDAWASGHMWGRWGGPEVQDFNFDRPVGFAVATLTGLIHGGKAALDDSEFTKPLAPWDDSMNAPHPDDVFVDAGGLHPGVGDRFLPELLGNVPAAGDFSAQRRALFGCAVDGLREVYGATAQQHGEMGAPDADAIDTTRHVADDSCWSQRATNRAIAAGCGIDRGHYPDQKPIEIDGGLGGILLLLAETSIAPLVASAPPLSDVQKSLFHVAATYACALAKTLGADPTTADGTEIASGLLLPPVLGISPNHAYARGTASTPPARWADPFLPWNLTESDERELAQKEALNLAFADANVLQRCKDFTEADLNAYRTAVSEAGSNPLVRDARCAQCGQLLIPHLRFGRATNYDTRREALCGFIGPLNAAFVYTDEDASNFTGAEPGDVETIRAHARVFCGCETAPTTTTSTTLPPQGINGCEPEDYIDLTAAAADRTIRFISFNLTPRCVVIRSTQELTFSGNNQMHSMRGRAFVGGMFVGSDVFTAAVPVNGTAKSGTLDVGDYGMSCSIHVSENGAIHVVP
jgi:hypothetical protein